MRARGEWPTLCALLGCYCGWLLAGWFHDQLGWWLTALLAVPLVTFHSSLQHESLHGHPTRSRRLNEALVYLPLGLFVPYRRFRTLHLRHHNDENLTDPFDDPESWYLQSRDWDELSGASRLLLQANGSLAGRLLLGPGLSIFALCRNDWQALRRGDHKIGRAWLHHGLGLVPVVLWVWWICGMSPLLYAILVAYPAYSLLMVRTFAEHRAAEEVAKRTAIVESASPFALLFLNNNLHAAHHQHPGIPWYRLPAFYRSHRAQILRENGGYAFRGYSEIFRRFFFRRREPVVHPLRRPTHSEPE